ncbi:Retrovirus-related Pol polyprotein from transposon 412 [Araneus ventricosus]|uniref:RNA-directed DNA polymerase n=1 Tax=Araneus ventricosus TaxID=182803 RepID=A0A4Y2WRD0_ARAVE|nr:Retrovirus-related Pol polyprotein from transposon 412 [Araneus ventricosus]
MSTLLVYPSPDARLSLTCDASDRALGSVLSQEENGVKATVKLVGDRFLWPVYKKQVAEWTRCCVPCQRGKIQRHTVSPLGTYPVPRHRFDHVHIDLVGPLPPSLSYTYALTCVDRFLRWPKAIPLKDIKAETVASEFYANWIARFGVPERLTSDQDRQFESQLFREFARLLGVKAVHTTLYHPHANGSVERLHRQLKSAIRAHATERWTLVLPSILLGIRASVKEPLNCSVAEMVYGTPITLPGEFFSVNKTLSTNDFLTSLQQRMSSLRPIPMSQHAEERFLCIRNLITVLMFSFDRIDLLSLWFLPIVGLILLFLELRSILPFKWDLVSRRLASTD